MDVVQAEIEQGAYVAGYGVRSLRPFAFGFVIPGVFVVVGVTKWSHSQAWKFVVLGLVAVAVLSVVVVRRLRRIARREVVLRIDSRGVWLGGDGVRISALEPWSAIDAVVYFDSWHRSTSDSGTRVPHIGVVRRRKIVNVRNTSDWQVDRARAGAAITKFGGVPFREAPVQEDVPRDWYHGIPLPDDWFTASP